MQSRRFILGFETRKAIFCSKQAVGPVALVSLLLSDSLGEMVAGSVENTNPNRPANPEAQQAYNEAAIQVTYHHKRFPISPAAH